MNQYEITHKYYTSPVHNIYLNCAVDPTDWLIALEVFADEHIYEGISYDVEVLIECFKLVQDCEIETSPGIGNYIKVIDMYYEWEAFDSRSAKTKRIMDQLSAEPLKSKVIKILQDYFATVKLK